MEFPYLLLMKTTLNVREDLYRRAKAQAALQGKSLSRFIEESLERMLRENSDVDIQFSDWAGSLPTLSDKAIEDLNNVLSAPDFRPVEPEMWE